MTKEKQGELETLLDGLDFEVQAVRDALRVATERIKDIREILKGNEETF